MLSPGTRLGPYEIGAMLGAGGMGEVYRAIDVRLQREVAVKVLPAELVKDPARRQRFTKEAQAASALNHPNVVAVFDVDLSGEAPYIVYELVEGVTLRHLMSKPMPPRRIVELGMQVADGLAAAHQIGLMHRDLKPENIIVTRDGRAKILDFGLAKLEQPKLPEHWHDAATRTEALTIEGNLIGTVNYMSPEQAAGRAVDRRADLFSFGLILYEMAAGKRPFSRKTTVETLSAVITDEPPPIEADIPLPLRLTIGRCLQKEPEDRYESTRDLLADLRAQREYGGSLTSSPSGFTTRPVPAPSRRHRLPWRQIVFGAATLGAGLLLGLIMAPSDGVPGIPANRFRPLATSAELEDFPVWSPDGKSIAYHARVDGKLQIFTRNADSSGPMQVTRSAESCESPQWSADGRRLFFQSKREVYVVGAAGGAPELLVRDVDFFAASPNGETLAILRRRSNPNGFSILLSSPPGAPPVKYEPAPFDGPDFNAARLSFAPDNKRLLLYVSIVAAGRPSEFWILPPPAGSARPRRVLEGLSDVFPVHGFDWLPDGRRLALAFSVRPDVLRSHISIADLQTGKVEPLITGIGSEARPTVSRDGAKLAYTVTDRDVRIVAVPLDGSAVYDMVATSRVEHWPVWSPKAHEFAYITDRAGQDEIWVADPEHGWDRPVVTQASFSDSEMPLIDSLAFSPSGDRIAFSRAARIWISPMSGGAPVRLTPLEASQLAPTWSPDGNWIAFYSRGKQEGLIKARVGSAADPILIYSTNRGRCQYCAPDWSPRGDWIAYFTDGGTLLLSPEPGGPKRVIRNPPLHGTAWSRDGATLYGLVEESGKQRIVAIDVATGSERVVNRLEGSIPLTHVWLPGFRLSLAPDGKSLAATGARFNGDIWMVSDFDRGLSWMARLGLR